MTYMRDIRNTASLQPVYTIKDIKSSKTIILKETPNLVESIHNLEEYSKMVQLEAMF